MFWPASTINLGILKQTNFSGVFCNISNNFGSFCWNFSRILLLRGKSASYSVNSREEIDESVLLEIDVVEKGSLDKASAAWFLFPGK